MAVELPELDYKAWEETKTTLHLICQIIGKVKMAYYPKQNQWWHVTLHLSPSGITTLNIPHEGKSFEIELDVHQLKVLVKTSEGQRREIELANRSVADIYQALMKELGSVGYNKPILAKPYDNPHSTLDFEKDFEHKHWDHESIKAYWRVLLFVDECFRLFAGHSFHKTSPAHLFWHSFDYAVTRFSGRDVNLTTTGNRRSDIEAYSHEVVSFGFWPGDPKVQFPAFYSYTAPEPKGIEQHQLAPQQAWWQDLGESHLAMLKYDDLRASKDPKSILMQFLTSANDAGCKADHWQTEGRVQTTPFWDALDKKFPATANREHRS
ncbi:MAG: hypothetical protein HRT45_08130 [Bdellovibrionales bacterium]|nr:hypothetical protein [Bdellovibrionales bacterium]